MFGSIRQKWKSYIERNETAHAAARAPNAADFKTSLPPLPTEIAQELEQDLEGDLHVLDLHNDDITPMDYVVAVIQQYSKREGLQAVDLMQKIHSEGSGQLIAGSKGSLERVATHIENDARARKFPLKCTVCKA